VVGVSRDRPQAQRAFAEKQELSYTLLCDTDGEIARAYGVKGLLGYANRVTFLIDTGGRISKVYSEVSPRTHAVEVLEDLRRLEASK